LALPALFALGCSGDIGAGGNAPEPTTVETTPTPEPSETFDEPEPEPEQKPLLQAQVEDILLRTCGECHGQNGRREAGMNYIEDLDALATNGKIVPGDADASLLVKRLRNGSMPPVGNKPPTPDEIEQIAQFINGWAGPDAAPPEVCEGQFITFDEIYKLISTDLLNQESDDRENFRYIGVTNRFNAGVCNGALDKDRWAMSKLLNSLSTENNIVAPVPVDERELIYRIDLRDYGWNRDVDVGGQGFEDGWEAIIANSPYAVPFEGNDVDGVTLLSGTAVPFMFADALTAAASIGDLYYGLVDMPDNLDELLDFLRIDVQRDFDTGRVARAGTSDSGVSRADRLIERHDIGNGGIYYQAFDFEQGSGQDIFLNPIDFQADGTESIFSLPNGLHAYVIFDGAGNREESSDLLFDSFEDSNFDVTSAASCMTCHSRGLLQVRDQVREFVEGDLLDYDREEVETVREAYPAPEDMDEIIGNDRLGYQDALEDAGVPTDIADPVSDVFWRFQEPVKYADIAGTLGVTPEFLQKNAVRLDVRMRTVSPDRDNGLRRRNFDDLYLQSLCILQIGSRNAPLTDLCETVVEDR
jgi:mono/diheme cytochrome c family protein